MKHSRSKRRDNRKHKKQASKPLFHSPDSHKVRTAANRLEAGQQQPASQSVQLERPDVNSRIEVIVVPEFGPDDPRAQIPRSPHGSNSTYRVTFVLAVPGRAALNDDLDLRQIMDSGDSLLKVPGPEIAKVKVTPSNENTQTDIFFSVNGLRNLATAQIRVDADSFKHAHAQAFNLVMPILSWWSFRYDVAIDVSSCELLEERTDARKWVVGVVGKTKLLNGQGNISKPEYRALLASYREGINATNPFYQILCFYRVIEGVRNLRTNRRQALLSAGSPYREPAGESLPETLDKIGINDPTIAELFSPYLGRKFTWVTDQFREVLRNAIAHLDPTNDSRDFLIADKFEDVSQCDQKLPVIRYISRKMLQNELEADPDMAGSV